MPSTLGEVTRIVFLEDPEPGKLHIEFEAAAALKKGQQVKLGISGTIVALASGDSAHLNLGVLIQDVASGERATVAVKGYAVIIARAGAALNAGPVQIGDYDTTNDRPVYATATGAGTTVGYNITQLAAAGENNVILI